MIYENILWIFQVWFASLLIGLISWPFSAIFFNKISDRGYSLAKIIGWVVLSYSLFVLATMKVVSLSLTSLIFLVLVWTGINFFIEHQKKVLPEIKWKQIILIEIMFLTLLSVFSYIKGHQPEIYQIERWMDFGFIQALFNTDKLPLFDIWFLGENLNYYYFGHVIGYAVLSLSRISLVPGFYILTAWIFSLLGINVYRLGKDLILLLNENAGWKSQTISGVLSFFNVILAGTMYSVLYIYEYLRYKIYNIPIPFHFYPEPTRILPGAISDMPIYEFIVWEIHAHVWDLLTTVIVLAINYCMWQDEKTKLDLKNKYLWISSFFIGIAYLTNSYDALTLGGITVIFFIVKYYKENKIKLISYCAGIAIAAYAFALPWSLFINIPSFGVGIVKTTSPFLKWFSFWGTHTILIGLFLIKIGWRKWKEREKINANKKFYLLIILISAFFLMLLEIFYIQDILKDGDWFRANTYYKVAMQVWVWTGVIFGPMIVWTVISVRKKMTKTIMIIFLILIIIIQGLYPAKAIWQAHLQNKKFTGLETGLKFWENKYPYDYEAYLYLMKVKEKIPGNNKIRNIVEAEGDSYTDASRFSVFLGWPTIIGYPMHEWHWREKYDIIQKRRDEVKEIYAGKDLSKTKEILTKYKIDYIVVGQLEKQTYKDELKNDKLMKIGTEIFENKEAKIIEVR